LVKIVDVTYVFYQRYLLLLHQTQNCPKLILSYSFFSFPAHSFVIPASAGMTNRVLLQDRPS